MGDFAIFSPGDVNILVNGLKIVGFADDSVVKVSFNEDKFRTVTGIDGHVIKIMNKANTGKIEINLMQTSDSNGYLNALYLGDVAASGRTFSAVTIKNAFSDLDAVISLKSWIIKLPDWEISKDPSKRVWVFECADLQVVHGGSYGQGTEKALDEKTWTDQRKAATPAAAAK